MIGVFFLVFWNVREIYLHINFRNSALFSIFLLDKKIENDNVHTAFKFFSVTLLNFALFFCT